MFGPPLEISINGHKATDVAYFANNFCKTEQRRPNCTWEQGIRVDLRARGRDGSLAQDGRA